MCTISWFYHRDGYDVFFNRDEQVSRAKAIPPEIKFSNHVRGIMPIDPQGGGTWIGVNHFGCTFALLNYYQGRLPKGKLLSRGGIIPALLAVSSADQVADILAQINLNKYAPFSLLFFSQRKPSDAGGGKIPMFRWTGKELAREPATSPLISSAINYELVLEQRLSLYRSQIQCLPGEPTPADFYRLHQSHKPEKSAYSVCMHRTDAKTVSLSHISVGETIQFRYIDGSPCENGDSYSVEIPVEITQVS